MLLVVDFTDLGLKANFADIRLEEKTDFSVGDLLNKLSDGVEEITGEKVGNSLMLDLLDSSGDRIDAALKVSDLKLNDWDTLYIVRRR